MAEKGKKQQTKPKFRVKYFEKKTVSQSLKTLTKN